MFTGIIEALGTVTDIQRNGTNYTFWVKSPISSQLKVDQSLSHNGVCLTVEAIEDNRHKVTAIEETINKTNLGALNVNNLVNLERCLSMNGRIDGHIVQGHVDTTATCSNIVEKAGSWEYTFELSAAYAALMIEKGSITLNGISLTIFNVTTENFTIAVIPYTYVQTNIHQLKMYDIVNIEFDMIGKYVNRIESLKLSGK